MTILAALVVLPRARAANASPMAQTSAGVATTASPATKTGKPPTCQSIMQRLSGSLAGTPSPSGGHGNAVLVDVDKAGVTMACSQSDAVVIPVPGGTKVR